MGKQSIYRIVSSKFEIVGAGFIFPTSVSMTTTLGAIPMVRVGIDISNGKRKSSGTAGSNTIIEAFSLDTMSGRLQKLLDAAAKRMRCNLEIEVEGTGINGGTSTTQKLSLKGWYLVAAGLGEITTTSGFSAMCTIAHPAYRLATNGGFTDNCNCGKYTVNDTASLTDPIDAGKWLYGKIAEAGSLTFNDGGEPISGLELKSGSTIKDNVNSILKALPKVIDETLRWAPELGGGGKAGAGPSFPCMQWASGSMIEYGIKKAVADMWVPINSSSVWDVFVRVVCSNLNLTVIPDYTSAKLPVAPFYPWMTATMSVDQENCSEISFPGTDPSPIYGVCASPQMNMVGQLYIGSYRGNNAQELIDNATNLAFVPATGDSAPNGGFFTMAFPEWLTSAILESPAFKNGKGGPHDIYVKNFTGTDKPKGNDAGSGKNNEVGKANDIKMQVLACEFYKLFKKRLEATVVCPLMFTPMEGGSPYLPGKVMKVTAGDGTLFEGYVVSMSHYLDMASSTGATSFHLAYCRPPGGYEVTKSVMDKNPMYS